MDVIDRHYEFFVASDRHKQSQVNKLVSYQLYKWLLQYVWKQLCMKEVENESYKIIIFRQHTVFITEIKFNYGLI